MELVADGRQKPGRMALSIRALLSGEDSVEALAGAVAIADGIHAMIALAKRGGGRRG
jgi:hypothetical protein